MQIIMLLFLLFGFSFAQGPDYFKEAVSDDAIKKAEAAIKDAAAKKIVAEEAKKKATAVKDEKKPRNCTSTCEIKWNETQKKKIAEAEDEAKKKTAEAEAAAKIAADADAVLKKASAEAEAKKKAAEEAAKKAAAEEAAKKKAAAEEAAKIAAEEEAAKKAAAEEAVKIAAAEEAAAEKATQEDAAKKAAAEYSPDMIWVKGSALFSMGCTREQGADCNDDERPAHNVTLSDFQVSKFPVTQKLWEKVMGSNPSRFIGENLPVESVSWNEVQEFIKKLNAITGKKYRLLTEAEWEYAARGGAITKSQKYAGSDNLNATAWYGENSGQKTHPVGTKQPNELGIYDMSGNVWEWVQDWKGSYSASGSKANPSGPASGTNRVYRGGSWQDNALYCRVSRRHGAMPDARSAAVGFRLALDR